MYAFLQEVLGGSSFLMPFILRMSTMIPVPKRIADEVKRRGFSLEELVIEALTRAANLDPQLPIEHRLELAEKYSSEAEEYEKKGDAIQASEKLYKVAEECIKALSEIFKPSALKEVEIRGKWETWLLGRAAAELSRELKEELVHLAWSKAYEIHVWCFHEGKYRMEHVEVAAPYIKKLLEYTKAITERKSR